jgi:membrane associated rhomboid family serine protease
MNPASVGFHCPECMKKGAQRVYRGPSAMRARPVLTQALIGLNLLVFALLVFDDPAQALRGGSTEIHFDYALVAELRVAPGVSVPFGVGDGEWYRMITSGFLHYGLIHILFNMYALWILGSAVEHIGGRGRLAAAYGVSIVAGSLGALLLSPDSFTAGASGGVFGLMGAILVAQRIQGIPFSDSPLIGVLMVNLLFTFSISNISIGGHIGGLVGGAVAGWFLFSPAVQRQQQGVVVGYVLCALAAVACVVGGVAVATASV